MQHMLERESTFIVVEFVEQTFGDHVEIVQGVGQRLSIWHRPTSAAISNHHSFQRNVVERRVESSLQVVLIDLPCEIGYIDSSVRFSTHK